MWVCGGGEGHQNDGSIGNGSARIVVRGRFAGQVGWPLHLQRHSGVDGQTRGDDAVLQVVLVKDLPALELDHNIARHDLAN